MQVFLLLFNLKHFLSQTYSERRWSVGLGLEHLSLKVQNVKFNFDVSVCYCMLSTDTSKSNSRPYNRVQMSIG